MNLIRIHPIFILFLNVTSPYQSFISDIAQQTMKSQSHSADHLYIEEYEVHKMIGDGGQANVYLASKGHQLFAIKVYLPGVSKNQSFKREVDFLEKLHFKHTINIVEFKTNAKVKVDQHEEVQRNIIVLQYAQNLDLYEYISKEGSFHPQTCKQIFKQLLQAIQFINNKGISHRDLKCENLLLDKNFSLKVSDFGLSTNSDGYQGDGIHRTKVGTQGFRSPQMEQGKKYVGLESDIFAAGVILFMMYAGSPPFLTTRYSDKIYRMIRDGNYQKFWNLHSKKREPGFFSIQFQRLMNSFFNYDPAKRPTLQSLKVNEWLNSVDQREVTYEQQLSYKFENIRQIDENKKKIYQIVQKLHNKQRKLSEQSTGQVILYEQMTISQKKPIQQKAQQKINKQEKRMKTNFFNVPFYFNQLLISCLKKPNSDLLQIISEVEYLKITQNNKYQECFRQKKQNLFLKNGFCIHKNQRFFH